MLLRVTQAGGNGFAHRDFEPSARHPTADSIPARNEIAVKLMLESGVAIDDLYAAVLPVQEKVGRPNDVHFAPEGYEVLAKAVAASIEFTLKTK